MPTTPFSELNAGNSCVISFEEVDKLAACLAEQRRIIKSLTKEANCADELLGRSSVLLSEGAKKLEEAAAFVTDQTARLSAKDTQIKDLTVTVGASRASCIAAEDVVQALTADVKKLDELSSVFRKAYAAEVGRSTALRAQLATEKDLTAKLQKDLEEYEALESRNTELKRINAALQVSTFVRMPES